MNVHQGVKLIAGDILLPFPTSSNVICNNSSTSNVWEKFDTMKCLLTWSAFHFLTLRLSPKGGRSLGLHLGGNIVTSKDVAGLQCVS